jgi:hypothetical protein
MSEDLRPKKPVREMTLEDINLVTNAMPPWARAQARLIRAAIFEATDLPPLEAARVVVSTTRKLYTRHVLIRAAMLEAVEAAHGVGADMALDIGFASMEIDETGDGPPRVRLRVKAHE